MVGGMMAAVLIESPEIARPWIHRRFEEHFRNAAVRHNVGGQTLYAGVQHLKDLTIDLGIMQNHIVNAFYEGLKGERPFQDLSSDQVGDLHMLTLISHEETTLRKDLKTFTCATAIDYLEREVKRWYGRAREERIAEPKHIMVAAYIGNYYASGREAFQNNIRSTAKSVIRTNTGVRIIY